MSNSAISNLKGTSKIVTSNQHGIHKRLDGLVKKHIQSSYQKPFQSHNLAAFDRFLKRFNSQQYNEMILDSCCGTGMSSVTLANQNPLSLVIGIDQSFFRLNKQYNQSLPANCLLLQANCEDFWRLCVAENIQFKRHFILYPNPWPKSAQLIRRWHGHPVFPFLKHLAKTTLLRSNWNIYLEEFSRAWYLLTKNKASVSIIDPSIPLTLFEKKYTHSGQAIFELEVFS